MKRVVFLTGTRADFGKLKSLIQITQDSKNIEAYIFATGMHLNETYGRTVDEIIKKQGLEQITDEDSINQYVTDVLIEFSEQKDQYLAGKEQVLGFLVGQVMKRTKGKANPKLVNEIIVRKIKADTER